jgi:Carboxypeptidase regulatory-like domain
MTRSLIAGLLLLISGRVAQGQTLLHVTGRVTYKVTYEVDSPLPGVTVTVTARGSKEQTTTAGTDGRFDVRMAWESGAPVTVTFEFPGFTPQVKTALPVPSDGTLNVDARLEIPGCTIADYVWPGAIEVIQNVDAVVRLRLSPSMRVSVRGCQFDSVLDDAIVIDTVKMTLPVWRSAAKIPVELEFEQESPEAGSEYLAFLSWDNERKRFAARAVYLKHIVNDRLQWDLDREYGLHANTLADSAVSQLRVLCRRTKGGQVACQ